MPRTRQMKHVPEMALNRRTPAVKRSPIETGDEGVKTKARATKTSAMPKRIFRSWGLWLVTKSSIEPHTTPCAIIASAIFKKPATFAPKT